MANCSDIIYFSIYKNGTFSYNLSQCLNLREINVNDVYYRSNLTFSLPNTSTYTDSAGNLGMKFNYTVKSSFTSIIGGKSIKELNFYTGEYDQTRFLEQISGSEITKKIDMNVKANLNNSSLISISNLPNLEYLRITCLTQGQGLSDLSFMQNLEHLETLSIRFTNVSALPDLTNLKTLKYLEITNSTLASIDNLSTLPNKTLLTTIILNNNIIFDLTALKDFSNLSSINLSDNKIETEKNTNLNGDVFNAKILDDLNTAYKAANSKNISLNIANNKLDADGLALLGWAKSK